MDRTGGPDPAGHNARGHASDTRARQAASTAPRCASLSRSLAEPLVATAPADTGSWLAVEHHGPWPHRAADTGPARWAGGGPLRQAAALGIRVQLVRRPGRRGPAPAGHTVLVAANRGGRPWLERAVLDSLDALADLDLAALADGRPCGFGRRSHHPALLVCTHGRKDACCARYGRPVAAAMHAAHPDRVWETTHLGGDRFAGNVVCLPAGTYHGRVTAGTAAAVAAACLAGQVHLPHYRGRAGLPAPAQAAEHAVRLATGLVDVDAVGVEAVEPLGCADLVRLRAGEMRVAVPVRPVRAGPPRPTSCSGCAEHVPTAYAAGRPYRLTATGAPDGHLSG